MVASPLKNVEIQHMISKRKNIDYKTVFKSLNEIIIITNNDEIIESNDYFLTLFPKTTRLGELFEKIDENGYIYDGYMSKRWYELALQNEKESYIVVINIDGTNKAFYLSAKNLVVDGENLILATLVETKRPLGYSYNTDKEPLEDTLLEQYKKAIKESNIVSKTDTNGIIIYVNDTFCEVLKYTREELMGRDHSMVRSPRTEVKTFTELWETIQTGEIWKGIVEDIDKDGSGHYFNTTIVPLKDTDGNIVEYMAIRQNISEIYAAKLEATKALEIKTQFLNKVSHELRTPLNAIINFVGQVLDDYDDIVTNPEFRKMAKNFLQRAENNSKNLLSFINSLLDVAKLESGKEIFAKESLEITSFLNEIYLDTHSLALGKDFAYNCKIDGEDLYVITDIQKLRQVVLNLISNAIKFTKNGFVELRLTFDDDFCTVEVADSGDGIPEGRLDDIFEAFVQVNNYDSGTGLGLKLVKEYCQAMEIDLSVQSAKDKGSLFVMKLHRCAKTQRS